MEHRTSIYAQQLALLIREKTVSGENGTSGEAFAGFRSCLRGMFPHIFRVCQVEEFDGSLLLCWKGRGSELPILLMNHHDVVEVSGQWKYPPFSGTIAEGKLWGRGTLDTKTGLWAMLQAAEELASQGYVPSRDIYFLSTCNEEQTGIGADTISKALASRGIRFYLVLDEGGMIVEEPIGGAKGAFAMIGVGEKGCADLKFIARSTGGHASTPGKDTPLVRLGKFMAAAEKGKLFPSKLSDSVCAMFSSISDAMSGPLSFVLRHSRFFAPILVKAIPAVSGAAGAMLKTTLAFTMASGSRGANVLPQEAWVIGNMRYSHHQGREASIAAAAKLAEKFGIETEVLDPGMDSPLSDHRSAAFHLVESAVEQVFPGTHISPYVMTAASDCRYMSRVCDNCLRFSPIRVSWEQMESIHGLNEYIELSGLVPAVEFYRYIITEV